MFEGWVGDEGDGTVLVDGPVITLQPEIHGHMDNLILRRVLISFLSSLIVVCDAIHERKK